LLFLDSGWRHATKVEEFYAATRVVPARIRRAGGLMQRHAALLARIERQFGVPATLLMWYRLASNTFNVCVLNDPAPLRIIARPNPTLAGARGR
jgi:hypothetical protein